MSDVYAGGNKATAVAAIKAAAVARWVTIADGGKDLDRESLSAWLRAEFDSMLGDAEASSAGYIAGIDVNALVAALNAKVRREAFMGRADWPAVNTTSAPQAVGAAVRERLAELQRLSADVTTFYAGTADKVFSVITGYLQSNVEADIPAGVVRIVRSSAVIATYVSDRGEESGPSPVSLLFDRDQNDTYTVTVPAPPGGRNITHFRLYEAASSSSTAAYLLVPNPDDDMGFPISDLSIDVTIKPEDLDEPCPSLTWEEPPADARYGTSIGNGINLVASGNQVRPSVAYRPHAYPPEFGKTTSHPITAMCGIDGVVVVGTRGPLKVLAGTDSASLAEIKHNSGQSVVSARGMVAMSAGVIAFPCPDGIGVVDGGGQVRVITGPDGADLFTKEEWAALNPSQIFAAELEGCYIFHVPAGFCYCLDLASGKLTTIEATGSAFYRDQLTDTLYMASARKLHALGSAGGRRTAQWRSKLVTLESWASMAWLQANSDYEANVTVRLYRDGVLHHTAVLGSRSPVRVPSGRGLEWELEVESTARVTSVTAASSTAELKAT